MEQVRYERAGDSDGVTDCDSVDDEKKMIRGIRVKCAECEDE